MHTYVLILYSHAKVRGYKSNLPRSLYIFFMFYLHLLDGYPFVRACAFTFTIPTFIIHTNRYTTRASRM